MNSMVVSAAFNDNFIAQVNVFCILLCGDNLCGIFLCGYRMLLKLGYN